jgi:hypothetical protein
LNNNQLTLEQTRHDRFGFITSSPTHEIFSTNKTTKATEAPTATQSIESSMAEPEILPGEAAVAADAGKPQEEQQHQEEEEEKEESPSSPSENSLTPDPEAFVNNGTCLCARVCVLFQPAPAPMMKRVFASGCHVILFSDDSTCSHAQNCRLPCPSLHFFRVLWVSLLFRFCHPQTGLEKWLATREAWCRKPESASNNKDVNGGRRAVPIDVDGVIDVLFDPRWRGGGPLGGRVKASLEPPRFPKNVPLPQMIDVLTDLWEAEGLDI